VGGRLAILISRATRATFRSNVSGDNVLLECNKIKWLGLRTEIRKSNHIYEYDNDIREKVLKSQAA